jgi:hypothetical protein
VDRDLERGDARRQPAGEEDRRRQALDRRAHGRQYV